MRQEPSSVDAAEIVRLKVAFYPQWVSVDQLDRRFNRYTWKSITHYAFIVHSYISLIEIPQPPAFLPPFVEETSLVLILIY